MNMTLARWAYYHPLEHIPMTPTTPTPERELGVRTRGPCDVCSQPLERHNTSAGIPICPGIYAPGYRDTLHKQIESLLADKARLEADRARFAEALFQMRDMLIAVHDGIEDEGDRVYLGSTNHAELLHEAWHLADALKWDEILEARSALNRSQNNAG